MQRDFVWSLLCRLIFRKDGAGGLAATGKDLCPGTGHSGSRVPMPASMAAR